MLQPSTTRIIKNILVKSYFHLNGEFLNLFCQSSYTLKSNNLHQFAIKLSLRYLFNTSFQLTFEHFLDGIVLNFQFRS